MIEKAVYFDMDGTIANLYGVTNWRDHLQNNSIYPYEYALPLLDFSLLSRLLNRLQKKNYTIGIVSWCSKNSTAEFDEQIRKAKIEWLNTFLPAVKFTEIHIEKYGTPKQSVVNCPNGILFDDEIANRENWTGQAYDEKDIINILKTLINLDD